MPDVNDVGSMAVSALASDTVVRIEGDKSLRAAARVMADADIGVLAVGEEDGAIRAVLSERDVLRAVADGRDPSTTPVGDVASTTLRWCDAEARVAAVAAQMLEHWVRHVLVEADGRLVGIVSARDLLGAYASADLANEE
jgi:CBS domain-containing protein